MKIDDCRHREGHPAHVAKCDKRAQEKPIVGLEIAQALEPQMQLGATLDNGRLELPIVDQRMDGSDAIVHRAGLERRVRLEA